MPTWVHRGCRRGWVPLRSWKILYFWNWNHAIWWILLGANLGHVVERGTSSVDLTDPNCVFWEEILVKTLLESLKISHFSFSFFFFLKDKSKYFHLCTTFGGGWLRRPSPVLLKSLLIPLKLTHKSSIWKYNEFLYVQMGNPPKCKAIHPHLSESKLFEEVKNEIKVLVGLAVFKL